MNKSSINHDASNASNLHFAQQKSKENRASVLLGIQSKSDTFPAKSNATFFQPKLQVNKINDPFEVEADRVADEVTQSIYTGGEGFSPPAAPPTSGDAGTNIQRLAFFQRKPAFESPTELDLNTASNSEAEVQRSAIAESITTTPPPPATHHQEEDVAETETGEIQRKVNLSEMAEGQHTNSDFESKLHATKGGGTSMSRKTRTQMESAFGADFSNVRIHTDSDAEGMSNQVQAHAFTHGRDIYFNKGTYQPEQKEGTRLLAHELTHVVQQGAATKNSVQRSANVQVNQSAPAMVQRGVISRARNWAANAANNIPGFPMLTVVLGFNPINGRDVPRNAANVFRGIMGFLPGGNMIWEALNNHGIFDKVGNWIVKQVDTLKSIGSSIVSDFKEFLSGLGVTDIARLGSLWREAKGIFVSAITKIGTFVKGLAIDILKFIKDAILKPLASLAEGTRAWDLLIAVLGENPITGETVTPTPDVLIGGFMKLIGQEEIWENIKKGNAIARAWAWFQGAMKAVVGLVRSIPGRFIKALKSLTIVDLVLVPRAFAKIVGVFASFAIDFASWAGNAMWELLKIIFSVVAPGAMPYLEKAGGALRSIFQNPGSFVGNMIAAGKLGFQMFKNNIGSILKEVLIDWLTGTLSGAGIYIPTGLTFPEILKFILSVLGLTWENMRAKLVEHFGEGPVTVLEEGFELIKILVTEGPGAAWEKIQEHLSNLQETVISEIINWVTKTVVVKAVAKIVSVLIPGAGFIQAIIAIWGVIKVFIQRIQKIIQVGVAFMNSIMEIASGNIQPAALKVVNTLKGILVLAVSFFAEFAGLGKVGQALQNILKKIRDPIDKAMDKVILWIKGKAKGFLKKKDDAEHVKIKDQAIADMQQGDVGEKTYDQVRAEKMAKAKEVEQLHQGKLKDNIKITIGFKPPEGDKEDSDLDFTVTIAPNTTKGKGAIAITNPNSAADLAAAKAHFAKRLFPPSELEAFLINTRGISRTTKTARVGEWKSANQLFSHESGKKDSGKEFSFDKSKIPKKPRPVNTNNRSTYGYSNPSHSSPTGIAIIKKGLIKEKNKPPKTGYKYKYAPGKENDTNYLQKHARFKDMRGSGKILKWGKLVLGHHPMDASQHWNRIGHKKTKKHNVGWNNKPKNYWGPEDPKGSAGSGGGSQRYKSPIPHVSHPMWWNPNHKDYAGKK
ncbi:eCIS core domain-containing protein [Aquimarina algiphila]|uniref:eCIS core domain-containing protein n=1 Tax=Aquimarina algiphila TaxID=2047982 RepID=UPI0023312FF8|nr:DUF4157 domain-containing protein [Aquimarina algiphila]